MKTKSRSPQPQKSGYNKRYVIGSRQTPVGPTGIVVWLTEVTGFDKSQPHMVGVRRYRDTTLWVRDNDPEVKSLIRDREHIQDEERRQRAAYAEYLQQQQHGKRK
jgi:hypothetical protein